MPTIYILIPSINDVGIINEIPKTDRTIPPEIVVNKTTKTAANKKLITFTVTRGHISNVKDKRTEINEKIYTKLTNNMLRCDKHDWQLI
jgi:hypothetical protein